MKKQTISFLLSLILLLNLLPLSALAGDASGECGEGVTWFLDTNAGVLSFEGSGRISTGYALRDSDAVQWWQQSDVIREIRFGEGILAIGAALFDTRLFASYSEVQRMRNVRTVRVPETVKQIGENAFCGLTRLDEITVLNPNCMIEQGDKTLGIPGRTVVVGYPDSTARRYAERNGFEFRAIRCADGAHVFDDTVITPQTCTEAGVAQSVCTICGYQTRRAIPAGHDYAITERLARTVYTCTRCGDSYVAGECRRLKLEEQAVFTVKAGAYPCFCFTPEKTDVYWFSLLQTGAWNVYGDFESPGSIYDSSGKVVAKSSSSALMEAGQTYYYCLCQVYDDDLQVSAEVFTLHDFRMTATTATCTAGGTTSSQCRYCGERRIEEVSALGHEYAETVLTAPTCTEAGLASYSCVRCGKSYIEPLLPAHQYVYDAEHPWYQHAVCALCGSEWTRGTADPPVLELGKETAARFDSEGLCCFRFTADASDLYTFRTTLSGYGYSGELCSAVSMVNFDPFELSGELAEGETCYLVLEREGGTAEGFSVRVERTHDYSGEIIAPASCTSEGRMTFTCSFCGDTYTVVIPEDHEWDFDIDLPWYRHGKCRLCGKTGEFGARTPPVLVLGQETQPEFDSEGRAFLQFTAVKEDQYSFRFTESCGDHLHVYDRDGEEILWYYDSFDNECRILIRAGQTVYLEVDHNERSAKLPTLVAEQIHNYWYVETQAPTCTEEGLAVGMCVHCGDLVTQTVPPRHSYEHDVWLPWYEHAVCSICGDEIEEGSRTPPTLPLAEITTAQIDEPYDRAYYRLIPGKSGIYRFRLPDPNGSLELMNPDGDTIRWTDWDFDEAGSSSYEYALFAGQTYYISLGLESNRVGQVRLSSAQIDEISLIDIQPGSSKPLPDENETAYLRFTAAQTGYYEFSSDLVTLDGSHAVLLDAVGSRMDCISEFRDDGFRIRFRLEAGQSCILEINPDGERPDVLLRQVDSLIDYTVLEANRVTTFDYDYYGRTYFSFTPQEDGYYEFASRSGLDTGCTLYDAEMNMLDYSDDSANGPDFRIRAFLEAGKTYYFGVSCYQGGRGTQIPVVLRRINWWSEPEYYWSGDYVTAVCYDVDNPYLTKVETVRAECLVTKEATYSAPGEEVYIAVFQNELFDTQTRVETIPILVAPPLPCDGEWCPGAALTDMPAKEHWAHDAIDWALVTGVTTGTSETAFSPGAGCTRAQVATFLWRAAGKPMSRIVGTPFADVQLEDYFFEAVQWALGEDITTGTSEERFSPNAVCTRAQIVTFLWRFDGCEEPEGDAAFTDVPAGAYYEKAVAWASEKGVTTGTEADKFSPDATCTRAQVVTFLYRYLAA